MRWTQEAVNDILKDVAGLLGFSTDKAAEGGIWLHTGDGRYTPYRVSVRRKNWVSTLMQGELGTIAGQLMALRDGVELSREIAKAKEDAYHAAHDDGLAVMTMMITYNPERFGDDKQVNDMAGRVYAALRERNVDVLDYRYFTNGLDEGDRDSLALAMQRREATANGDS